ncbi:hypothetical protein QUF63_14825 [Anaerolineales bacterium HSG25]|nr:hypothetical protein [Anaerolineales bacterium HSG25]
MTLIKPYISLYAFFNGELPGGENLAKQWQSRLTPILSEIDPDYACESELQRKVWVVYGSVDVTEAERYPMTVWSDMSQQLFGDEWQTFNRQVIGADWYQRTDLYWGLTVILGAALPIEQPSFTLTNWDWLADLTLPLPDVDGLTDGLEAALVSQQRWGKLWQLNNETAQLEEYLHLYLALSPDGPLSEQAEGLIFGSERLTLVEMSLHKAYRQLQLYERGRATFHRVQY